MLASQSNLLVLSSKLDVNFRNQALLEQAFVHRSYLNESKKIRFSNERLEFLGDSILSFLVSNFLFTNYPNFPEGELTNIRSAMVKTSTLAEISKNLDLGQYLMLSRGEEEGGGRENSSILADTFEALLGALFIDQGLDCVRRILEKFLFPRAVKILSDNMYKDAKSIFQEIIQEKMRFSPIYKVLEEKGPDHAKKFTIGVYVNHILYGKGNGKSKQEAEMNAAESALEKLKEK